MIIMNPPFSADEKHILHAWNIAPDGCDIIALCNWETISNTYYRSRVELIRVINEYGSSDNLGDCFSDAERKTNVEIGLIRLKKPGSNENKFEGFFLDEEIEEQYNGIMPYNFVRDLVNRYVAAVKIFDEQLEAAVRMNNLTSTFYSSSLAMSMTEEDKPKSRTEFKKDLQKSGWNFIFKKMNMDKYTTKGLKEDINKFVEKQEKIPFTMKNIYRMLEIVAGTTEQRMDKAIIEVFDKLTQHYHDNRYMVEGWKTNSHYMLNEKFIMPWVTDPGYDGSLKLHYRGHYEIVDDMTKALCFITGTNYDTIGSLWNFFNKREINEETGGKGDWIKHSWNTWYDWGFFQLKGFKKGTMHFKFKDRDVWAKFNLRVAKIKGYPLPEKL